MSDPTLNLTAMAACVLAARQDYTEAIAEVDADKAWTRQAEARRLGIVLGMWQVLTGLEGPEAEDYARQIAQSTTPVVAHVAPF